MLRIDLEQEFSTLSQKSKLRIAELFEPSKQLKDKVRERDLKRTGYFPNTIWDRDSGYEFTPIYPIYPYFGPRSLSLDYLAGYLSNG